MCVHIYIFQVLLREIPAKLKIILESKDHDTFKDNEEEYFSHRKRQDAHQ
jgi:hypothetical protein